MGRHFGEVLSAAVARGVEVRVLLDGVADNLYRPRGSRMLRRLGVPGALFLPPRLWPPMLYVNLRNHRKLLLVDGDTGFTGGMNISQGHLGQNGVPTIADVHFRIRGSLVRQMDEVFIADWNFAAPRKLQLSSPHLAPDLPPTGKAAARVITDGPNEELDRLLMVLIGALSAAHQRIWIMTPYFLPPASLVGALQAAALRGVEVVIIVPARSDQPWMDWATHHVLPPLLKRQVQVLYRPPPFAHSKLLLVDDWYVQFGSANLDARSLRLNFELVVEAFDASLARRLADHFAQVRAVSRPASREELSALRLPQRLRDALCWLFSPYL